MFIERLFQHLAVSVIVLERTDLLDTAKSLEGSEVQLVDVGEVGIRNDYIGQRLNVPEAVGYPAGLQCLDREKKCAVSHLVGSSRRQ
jgi:hypothetical protein